MQWYLNMASSSKDMLLFSYAFTPSFFFWREVQCLFPLPFASLYHHFVSVQSLGLSSFAWFSQLSMPALGWMFAFFLVQSSTPLSFSSLCFGAKCLIVKSSCLIVLCRSCGSEDILEIIIYCSQILSLKLQAFNSFWLPWHPCCTDR